MTPFHAYELFEQAEGGVRAVRGARAFAAIPSVKAAFETGSGLVGVIGLDRIVGALVKFGVKLVIKSRLADEGAAEDMVGQMRADVPLDSGRLLNGITYEIEDNGTIVVTASAVHPGGDDDDYARYVEFGTFRMDAEPFFMSAAREALERRGASLDDAVAAAAEEEGLSGKSK